MNVKAFFLRSLYANFLNSRNQFLNKFQRSSVKLFFSLYFLGKNENLYPYRILLSKFFTSGMMVRIFILQENVPPVVAFKFGSLGFLTPFLFESFREILRTTIEGIFLYVDSLIWFMKHIQINIHNIDTLPEYFLHLVFCTFKCQEWRNNTV